MFPKLLTNSLYIAFKEDFMCVCVVFFFGLNHAHANNISYLAEAFIPTCDQISESSEAKMYNSLLKFSTKINVYTMSMNDNVLGNDNDFLNLPSCHPLLTLLTVLALMKP